MVCSHPHPALLPCVCSPDNNRERIVSSGALQRLVAALKSQSQHTNTVYYAIRALAQLAKVGM